MKQLLISMLLSILVSVGIGQTVNSNFIAFDTNGPMGECLFPQDNQWQEVVECNKTKEELLQGLSSILFDLKNAQDIKCEVNDENIVGTLFTCKMKLRMGDVAIEVPFVGEVHKPFSEVRFDCKVEIKDNKYRITFSNFYTDRLTLRGEAKSEGPSNVLHWQRVNSLTKERADTRKKDIAEYDENIAREKYYYQAEWETVCKVMSILKTIGEDMDF